MMERFSGTFEFLRSDRADRGGLGSQAAGALLQILYFFLMVPGIILCLDGMGVYPPLDSRVPMGFVLAVFILPVLAHLLYSVLHPTSTSAQPWKTIYTLASAILVVLGVGLYLNGGLDRSPANLFSTSVVAKSVFQGSRGTRYTLTVSSWQPGKTLERLIVLKPTYDRARVGQPAIVEVHQGFFGLAWHSKIELQGTR